MKLNKGKLFRRGLRIFGVGFGLLILALILLPYLFKDKILAAVKTAANEQLTATVDFSDVGLSLFRSFPDFNVSIHEVKVTGQDEFAGIQLADIEALSIDIDLMSVLTGSTYVINEVRLEAPKLFVKVLRNGKANYDITKPSTEEAETSSEPSGASPFNLALTAYSIRDGVLVYDDASMNVYVKADGLNHSGSGNFSETVYELLTETEIDAFTLAYEGISYLNATKTAATFNVLMDMDSMKFTLTENALSLNALTLNFEGFVAMPTDDIAMDLRFGTPGATFASLLSLIPSAYTADFDDVKTTGAFTFSGFAKGIYNETQMPAFGVDLAVSDGSFQYPDLPLGVKDIRAAVKVNSPSSNLDQLQVDVSAFHFALGGNPFDMTLFLRTPMSDPDIRSTLAGKIDLTKLQQAFPLEDVEQLSGRVQTDLKVATKLSYVEQEQYDKVDMQGNLLVEDIQYQSAGLPAIVVHKVATDFSPQQVKLHTLDMKLGKSDIQASGYLDNILKYFSKDQVLRGQLTMRSKVFDANEWMTSSEGDDTETDITAQEVTDTTSATTDYSGLDRFDFAADIQMQKVLYDVYDIRDIEAKGHFTPEQARLETMRLKMGKSDLQASGTLENWFDFLANNGFLKGQLQIASTYFNVNQFLTEDGSEVEPEAVAEAPENPENIDTEIEAIALPANIDLTFQGKIGELIYDTYNLKNNTLLMRLHDQKLSIQELRAAVFGGFVNISGAFETLNPETPNFDLTLDVERVSIQEIAQGVGLVKYFLPVLKTFDGKLNTNFSFKSTLTKNLYPILQSIDARGVFETANVMIEKSPQLMKLANALNTPSLSTVNLTNTINKFKIENGRMKMDPFNIAIKDIDVKVEGSHGLDALDYALTFHIPKDKINKNPVGAAATQGLQSLQQQAAKLGVTQLGNASYDYVDLLLPLTGSLKSPQFGKVKLLGLSSKNGDKSVGESVKEELDKLKDDATAKAKAEADRLKQQAQAKADSLKQAAAAEADRLKQQAEARAKAEADRLKKQAEARAKAIQDSIKNAAKNKLKGLFNR